MPKHLIAASLLVFACASAPAQMARRATPEQRREQAKKLLTPVGKALQAKDYRKVVQNIDALAAKEPTLAKSLSLTKMVAMMHYDERGAQVFAAHLADTTFRDDSMSLNNIAWALVEDGNPLKHPDRALPIRIAQRASNLLAGKGGEGLVLDTLGLAYYRAGRIKDALATQTKAVKLAKAAHTDVATLGELTKRLNMYRKAEH